MGTIDVSIIIVTFNTREVTCQCVRSILASVTSFSYEVIVVDNHSSDDTVEELRMAFPGICVIASDTNVGFSKGNNLGIRQARGRYLMLLNSDTILFVDTIEQLVGSAIRRGYDICGPVLLNEDLSVQRSWFNFPTIPKLFLRLTDLYLVFYGLSNSRVFRSIFRSSSPAFMIKGFTEDTVMDYLSFACILISRKTVDEFGMLDENLTFYHEDCEYGMRLAASRHRVVYMVGARLIHLGGTSSIGASSFALENDVRGLLYLFGKYHPGLRFRWLKRALGTAFGWRIFFWHLGYYRHLRKFGLYEDKKRTVSREESLSILKKYKEIKRFIRQYEYR